MSYLLLLCSRRASTEARQRNIISAHNVLIPHEISDGTQQGVGADITSGAINTTNFSLAITSRWCTASET